MLALQYNILNCCWLFGLFPSCGDMQGGGGAVGGLSLPIFYYFLPLRWTLSDTLIIYSLCISTATTPPASCIHMDLMDS